MQRRDEGPGRLIPGPEVDDHRQVLGAESPASYAGLGREAAAALARADRPFADLRLSRCWGITLYPTPAYAEMEGIPLEEFVRFVVDASTIDPRPLLEAERLLEPFFADGKRMEVVTWHPVEGRELTLTMSLAESIPVLSHGLRNVPDGEVFTSPDAGSVEGEIYLDLPILNGGVDVSGMHLVFEAGRITRFSARATRPATSATRRTPRPGRASRSSRPAAS